MTTHDPDQIDLQPVMEQGRLIYVPAPHQLTPGRSALPLLVMLALLLLVLVWDR